jgi:cell division protein FtsA
MNLLYQSQRAMRAKREEAMRRGVIAVLDIGTFKIACLVLKFDETDIAPATGSARWRGRRASASSARPRPGRAG